VKPALRTLARVKSSRLATPLALAVADVHASSGRSEAAEIAVAEIVADALIVAADAADSIAAVAMATVITAASASADTAALRAVHSSFQKC